MMKTTGTAMNVFCFERSFADRLTRRQVLSCVDRRDHFFCAVVFSSPRCGHDRSHHRAHVNVSRPSAENPGQAIGENYQQQVRQYGEAFSFLPSGDSINRS